MAVFDSHFLPQATPMQLTAEQATRLEPAMSATRHFEVLFGGMFRSHTCISRLSVTSEEGAKIQSWAATAADVEHGLFDEPIGKKAIHRDMHLKDHALVDELWRWIEYELFRETWCT